MECQVRNDTMDKKIGKDEDVASLRLHWHRFPHWPLSLWKVERRYREKFYGHIAPIQTYVLNKV